MMMVHLLPCATGDDDAENDDDDVLMMTTMKTLQ